MQIVSPESVGFSSERLADINSAMQVHIDQGYVAGLSTLVARHGKVVHQATHGFLDVETGQPMPPDAIFRIASMTKPITSVAVMMLVEEGHFDLDTPISTFIPAFNVSFVQPE